MPVKPMLDGVELQLVQKVESDDQEVLAEHGVPALEGDFLQDLGRRVTRLSLTGVITGDEAADGLKTLREKFRAATPVSFVTDIATATKVGKVLIEELGVRELAGKPERFEYELTLREFLPPPKPEQEKPPPEPPIPPLPKVETGTLIVEVVVEGQPNFDFSKVTVTVEGTKEDGSTLSQTPLTNRKDNVWTEEKFPPGQFTAKAVVTDPPSMSGSAAATVRKGETTKVTITLRAGAVIAKAFVVHFRFDNSFVEPCMTEVLQQVAQHASAHPGEKLLIVGHTDKTGSNQYNQSLSERRARSVFAYLTFGRDAVTSEAEWGTLKQRNLGGLPQIKDSWGTRQYQYMLQSLGFYPAKVDGDHGEATDAAVRSYREARGLPAGTIVDDAVWARLIHDYMAAGGLAIPESQFLPNAKDSCNGGILKWVGCGEESPLPLPQPPTENPHRQYRRVEMLFVRAERVPCEVPQPDTFNLPAPGAVSSAWCLGPGNASRHCCFGTRDCENAAPDQFCIEPAEPETVIVRGSIKFEDNTPAANVKYVLIAPDGEFMDGEAVGGARRGDGNFGQTRADGTFEYPGRPKGVGIFTMEIDSPFVARADTDPPEAAKGNVVCKRLEGAAEFKVIVLREACRLLGAVHFEFDRSFVRPAEKRALRTLADFIGRAPASRRLLLAGHTDLVGDAEFNRGLSVRRSKAVFGFLTGNPPDPDNPARSIWLNLFHDPRENWGAREIQFMLLDLGFYCHHLTTVMDAETLKAVRAAKNRFGLGNNDVVDDVFLERLFTEYIAHNGAAVPLNRFLTPQRLIGCGEDHPIDIRGGAPFAGPSERNRRAEGLIFPQAPRPAPASPTDCSRYPNWNTPCEPRWLEFIGPKRNPADPADAEEELAFIEVSNWQNAFDFDPPDATGIIRPTGNLPRADFIDRDPDRIFIEITDRDRLGAGTIRARIKTIDEGGNDLNPFVEHELAENANEPGLFRSSSLLLVADEIDNGEIPQGAEAGTVRFQARGIANGALNDPLLRAKIGGQVVVEYIGAELGRLPACDPDCLKVVPVNIVILRRTDGTAVTTEADVQERVNRLQQNYMQCCIRFDVAIRTATAAEMPAGVILSSLSGIDVNGFGGLPNRTALTAEELALFESPLNARGALAPGGARTDVIQVFYANFLEAGALRATANSYNLAKYVVPSDDVVNCIVVGADNPEENSTLPHEMLHILLNQLHFPAGTDPESDTRTNLFFRNALGQLDFANTTVVSNKRIPEQQVERILNNVSGVIP